MKNIRVFNFKNFLFLKGYSTYIICEKNQILN